MHTPRRKKILVACNHLATVGGSELYTFYLIKALKRLRKYDVFYFTHEKGIISDRIEKELGVKFKSSNRFDLILASHNTTVNYLFGQGPILQICHGPIPEMEQPSPLANYHIAVSVEVKHHLAALGFSSTVVLNGIDMDTFVPTNPISDRPRRVLSLCQSKEANNWLAEICKEEELDFKAINKHRNPSFRIDKEINEADLVIGIGRSVYDAMACGRPCILFDKRSYNGNLGDGYLKPDRFGDFVRFNCSGRYSRRRFSKAEMKNEIQKYDKKHGKELRNIAQKRLNLQSNTETLLTIGFEISHLAHLYLQAKIMVRWKRHRHLFDQCKQLWKSKIKDHLLTGSQSTDILKSISKEEFIWPVKVSLYAYLLKLTLKRQLIIEKDP